MMRFCCDASLQFLDVPVIHIVVDMMFAVLIIQAFGMFGEYTFLSYKKVVLRLINLGLKRKFISIYS